MPTLSLSPTCSGTADSTHFVLNTSAAAKSRDEPENESRLGEPFLMCVRQRTCESNPHHAK
jgi:hypothetical protein